jgi:hypothetical protein
VQGHRAEPGVIAANLIFLAAVSAGPVPPESQKALPPITSEALVANTLSCVAATAGSRVSIERLKADGWTQGIFRDEGKVVEDIIVMQREGAVLILKTETNQACRFIATIDSEKALNLAAKSLTEKFGAKPFYTSPWLWRLSGRAVLLASEGKGNEKIASVEVVHLPEEKQ